MRIKRPWALPLVPLYGLGLTIKNLLYKVGWLRVRSLRRPVIGVGSLSAGGAGKTPVVMMLAELLERQGIGVDVLTRGYGRGSGVVERVDGDGSAQRFGDEPLEMARAGLRVFVGAERYDAGVLAESVSDARVHLLDDGFQHRRLGRALEIVLLTSQDIEDCLLPAGDLREPLRALRRADVVILREEEAATLLSECARLTGAEVWTVRRRLQLPPERPKRPVAFCGIARPEGFFGMLRQSGCDLAGTIAFADHHPYGNEDIELLRDAALHSGADGFVMTVKDAVKISPDAMERLRQVGPVWVARLQVELPDEQAALDRLLKVVSQ